MLLVGFLGFPLAVVFSLAFIANTSDDTWKAIGVALFFVIMHFSIKAGNYFDDKILNSGAKQAGRGKRIAKHKKRSSRGEYRYRGPEVERCPEHRWLFLVEKDGRHHCPECEKSYSAQDLGWEADATLGYLNKKGVEKKFNVLWNSIVPKGNSISVRVMPTFQRITLRRDRLIADKKVRYRNFRGEEKEFEILASSMRPKGAHFNVWVAPTFERIALHRDRILEQSDMAVAPATPALVESKEPEPVIINEPMPVVGMEPDPPIEVAESAPETAPSTDTVDVVITGAGTSTYDANKAVQDLKPGISYFDAYNLLRDFPKVAFENLPPAEAETIKARLEAAECSVELRPHSS